MSVGGIPIRYEEFGEGRPIFLLHGRPSNRVYAIDRYEPVFAAREGWHRIYPDLPGMGDTPGADSIETQDDYLGVVIEFVDAVAAGRPFALVGISWGAVIARGIVHERHERVTGLHLAQPRVDLGPSPAPPPTVIADDPDVVADVAEDEAIWLQVAVVRSRETLEAFRSSVKPGLDAADLDFLRRVSAGGGFSFEFDDTPPLAAPSLILAGRQDSMVGYARAVDLLEQYPRATLAVLDRAGHALDVEQQHLFTELVDEWLDRVEEWTSGRPMPHRLG